jgi:hypothetical protein
VYLAQLTFAQARVALIQPPTLFGVRPRHTRPPGGAAVADEVFGAGQDAQRVGEVVALEPSDGGLAERAREFRRLAEALVGAAPTLVARDGDAGGERPVDARGADFD